MVALEPGEQAWEFRHTMLEVLKILNRAEEEEIATPGVELPELHKELLHMGVSNAIEGDILQIVTVLEGNRMLNRTSEPFYDWTRSRTLGERFSITTEGKLWLVQQIQKNGRID